MVRRLIGTYLINLFALAVATQLIRGLLIAKDPNAILVVAAGFTLTHIILKTVLGILIKALNFLTLGIAGLVVDAVILYGLTLYLPQIAIVPWFYPGGEIFSVVLPAHQFGLIDTTISAALLINLLRAILLAIFYA